MVAMTCTAAAGREDRLRAFRRLHEGGPQQQLILDAAEGVCIYVHVFCVKEGTQAPRRFSP